MPKFNFNFQPEGPPDASLAVVCEKPHTDEIRAKRILVGKSGMRVRRHLIEAGVQAGDTLNLSKGAWLTNAVQSFNHVGNPTDADVIAELPRLYRELTALPNLRCIIGMGAYALKALSNMQYGDITNRRGSRLLTPWGCKFVPTFHPAFYMRGEWRYASVVQFDVGRAVGESTHSEIRHRFDRQYHIRPSSLSEGLGWMAAVQAQALETGQLSFDIETREGRGGTWYVTCIGFSAHPSSAYCIPIMHRDRRPYWPDLACEAAIWRAISETLNLEGVCYVTQNGCAFDSWQLRKHGVFTSRMATGFDTFSAHSLLAPDLPHDLGFLVSIYTDESYYKDESGRSDGGYGSVSEDQYWTYNCLIKETPVLLANLTWKPLGEIKVGDAVLSLEENPSGCYARRFRESIVTKTESKESDTIEIILNNGGLTGTEDHRVLTQRLRHDGRYGGTEWTTLKTLVPGDIVIGSFLPQQTADFDSGWLSGLFDGEGCLETRHPKYDPTGNHIMLAFSQKEGDVLDKALILLKERGFSLRIRKNSSGAMYAWINGGLSEQLRALALLQPIRLLKNFHKTLKSNGISGATNLPRWQVIAKRQGRKRVVTDITTTEGTFIANGVITHNCKDAALTLEVAWGLMEDLKSV